MVRFEKYGSSGCDVFQVIIDVPRIAVYLEAVIALPADMGPGSVPLPNCNGSRDTHYHVVVDPATTTAAIISGLLFCIRADFAIVFLYRRYLPATIRMYTHVVV